jgi:hypothetical protein
LICASEKLDAYLLFYLTSQRGALIAGIELKKIAAVGSGYKPINAP